MNPDSEANLKENALPSPQDSQPADDAGATPISEPVEKEPVQTIDIPDNTKRLISLAFTVLAVLLYGTILGGAIIKTLMDDSAVFTPGALRATQILAGLVGAVVTAGFARPQNSNVTTSAREKDSGLLPHWFIESKFLGLADTLGLNLRSITASSSVMPLEEVSVRAAKINTATWVAILYFIIYFITGAGAFVITVMRPEVPEIISSTAWVWLGTLITSSYSFFALGEGNGANPVSLGS